jgi:hypothetical protein
VPEIRIGHASALVRPRTIRTEIFIPTIRLMLAFPLSASYKALMASAPDPAGFASTRWSLILRARDGADAALETAGQSAYFASLRVRL